MENQEKNEVLSRAVKAGKRTYFFDVKSTKTDELYLTITESKRKFNAETGNFFYEKHKVFLYKEDFEKFQNALSGVIEFINTGKVPEETMFDMDSHNDDARFEDDFDALNLSL
ncbi:MAG: PUR family DNA/RNA-binding protein [Bacteroidales bacterium]|nr:PUR family DNA/RNA-binding protein [Bacteroidales bacterium]